MKLSLEPVITITPELEHDFDKMGLTPINFLDKNQRCFTAKFNGKHLAFVTFTHTDVMEKSINTLNLILVHPATRRRQVGLFLIQSLVKHVGGTFQCNFDNVTKEDLEGIQQFFIACGFKAQTDGRYQITSG